MARKKKDVSERLRAQTWYYFVKTRENLSDKKIFEKFVTLFGDTPPIRIKSLSCVERVKYYGCFPKDNYYITRYTILPKIYSDPLYKGAQEIADSPFWKVIGTKKLSLDEVRKIIVTCFGNIGVVNKPYDGNLNARTYLENIQRKAPPDMQAEELVDLIREWGYDYDAALGDILLTVPIHLDAVALIGALSLEAKIANEIVIAQRHKETFLRYLDEYCSQSWIKPISKDLFDTAKSRIETALKIDITSRSYIDLLMDDYYNQSLIEPIAKNIFKISKLRIENELKINKIATTKSYENLLKPLKTTSNSTQVEYFLNIHSRLLWGS